MNLMIALSVRESLRLILMQISKQINNNPYFRVNVLASRPIAKRVRQPRIDELGDQG